MFCSYVRVSYDSVIPFGWDGLVREFLIFLIGLGWVSQSMGWVGLGHIKLTDGQLCLTYKLCLMMHFIYTQQYPDYMRDLVSMTVTTATRS